MCIVFFTGRLYNGRVRIRLSVRLRTLRDRLRIMRRRNTLEFTRAGGTGKKRKLVLLLTGFVVFALLAGAVSLYVLWKSNDFDFSKLLGTRTPAEETTVPVVGTETQTDGETQQAIPITVLRVSVLCRNEAGKMSFLYILEADITGRTVNIIPIAADTVMKCSGKEMTAGEICSSAGYSIRDAYSETYGRTIDKYIEMDETAFKALIKELGNVTVTVDRDVPYDEDGVTYTIRAGVMSLTPDMLLRYMKYAESPEELTRAQAKAAKAILETYVTAQNVQKGTALFGKLANLVKTDFTALEYSGNFAALEKLVSEGISFTSEK